MHMGNLVNNIGFILGCWVMSDMGDIHFYAVLCLQRQQESASAQCTSIATHCIHCVIVDAQQHHTHKRMGIKFLQWQGHMHLPTNS